MMLEAEVFKLMMLESEASTFRGDSENLCSHSLQLLTKSLMASLLTDFVVWLVSALDFVRFVRLRRLDCITMFGQHYFVSPDHKEFAFVGRCSLAAQALGIYSLEWSYE